MLEQAKIVKSHEEGVKRIPSRRSMIARVIRSSSLYSTLKAATNPISSIPRSSRSRYAIEVRAENSGYVKRIDSMTIGVSAMKLGAGRATMTDVIDMSAGILLAKKVGDQVDKGDLLATCYTNKEGVGDVVKDVHDAFELSKTEVQVQPIVHAYIK
jgi:thymidine phosphorylase